MEGREVNLLQNWQCLRDNAVDLGNDIRLGDKNGFRNDSGCILQGSFPIINGYKLLNKVIHDCIF